MTLPAHWKECHAADVIEVIEGGLNIKCIERPPEEGEAGLVKLSAVSWGRFQEDESKTMPPGAPVDEAVRIRAGDLLISRANTIELVGACVLVERISKRLYLSDKVLRLRVEAPTKRWLMYYLRSPEGRRQIEQSSSGNQLSMRNISRKAIGALRIPLPPLNEQKRIADKLDQLLEDVEACKARLDRVPAILKRFRQSVLAAATSGELTEDWRAGHTYVPEWEAVSLSEVCTSIVDGDHQAPPRAESGIPFLVISNVKGGKIDLESVTRWVPETYYRSLSTSRRPVKHDILYTVTGTIAVPVLVDTDVDFCFQRHIALLKPDHSRINYKFLSLTLASDHVVSQAEAVATGTAQLTIPLRGLRGFKLRLPAREEQEEIVRRVEALFAACDALQAKLTAAQARVDKLTQSLLAKAFRGELVPQDPNDEPAEQLLARIAEAKERAAPRRGRKTTASAV